MTPIRMVQTADEVPTYGAIIREPTISKIISDAPDKNITNSKIYFFMMSIIAKHVSY
jgi:hypothetical protein